MKGSGGSLRVLAVVHVFYPRLWPELAAAVRNLGAADLIVTFVDEAAVVAARRDFPSATFLPCENRGYDVWPFLKALQTADLAAYDLVVKLHTKRDVDFPYRIVIGDTWLNGPRWRSHLLAFVRTPEAWRRTVARFRDPRVGMVADRHVIFGRRDALTDAHRRSFDTARATLNGTWGLRVPENASFVGGTMFAVRAAALRPFVTRQYAPEMFAVSRGHDSETLAHVLERMLGLAVCGQGYRLVAFRGSPALRRFGYALLRLFVRSRWSRRRHTVRVCGITVYRRKLA
ncbi:MAG: rhamnan synthesis F family protein [Kiritimatiellia bacterium]